MKLVKAAVAAVLVSVLGCQHSVQQADVMSVDDEQPLPPYEPINLKIDVNADAARNAPAGRLQADTGLSLAASSGDTYYMTVFGYQGKGLFNLPRNSHTYALFVHVGAGDLASAPLEGFVISWLPVDGVVQLGQGAKAGRNYSFNETMQIVYEQDYDIRRSPLVQISPYLYGKAQYRYNTLNNGAPGQDVRYKMIDDVQGRSLILQNISGGYSNCIHAVSDSLMYSNGAIVDTGTKHGFAASDAVFSFLSGYITQPGVSFDAALANRLGI